MSGGPNADFDKYEKHTCPFDANHQLDAYKWRNHIDKCRLQHPSVPIAFCKFNTRHVIRLDRQSMEDHYEECQSKGILEADLRPHVPKIHGNLNFPPPVNAPEVTTEDAKAFARMTGKPGKPYMIRCLNGPTPLRTSDSMNRGALLETTLAPQKATNVNLGLRTSTNSDYPRAVGRGRGRGRGRGSNFTSYEMNGVNIATQSYPSVGRSQAPAPSGFALGMGGTRVGRSSSGSSSSENKCRVSEDEDGSDSDDDIYSELAFKLIIGRGKTIGK